jgi:glycosyltransferase involved in cell wall biosynthesis
MPKADCFVSLIAPLQDDAATVAPFVDEVARVLAENYQHYEIVLVDDGSRDDTVARVGEILRRQQHVRLIRLTRSFGQEIAISAGLDAVIGDFVAVMLPGSDPPELVPELIDRCRGGADIVYGVRRSRAGEPLWSRLGARAFYGIANTLLRLGIARDATHLRALSRRAVNALLELRDRARFLRTLSSAAGLPSQAVEYEPRTRGGGARQRSFREALRLAVNVIVTNSNQPLRLMSLFGLGVASINVLYMGYIVAIYLFKERVAEGWVTQSMQNAVMYLCIFLILTVLCEYVGRVLDEVKGRPFYYVAEERQSSVFEPEGERNVVTRSEGDVPERRA